MGPSFRRYLWCVFVLPDLGVDFFVVVGVWVFQIFVPSSLICTISWGGGASNFYFYIFL